MAAVWLLVTATELAVIVDDAVPPGTVKDAGTPTFVRLEEMATTAPPTGAGPESVIVQTLESPPAMVPGLQPTEESTGGWMLIVALADVPPKVAVIFAATTAVTAEVQVLNNAEDVPAAIVTLAGTGAELLLLDTLTKAPPAGAGPLRVTAQLVTLPPITVDGLQLIDESLGALPLTVIVPTVPETLWDVPAPVAA